MAYSGRVPEWAGRGSRSCPAGYGYCGCLPGSVAEAHCLAEVGARGVTSAPSRMEARFNREQGPLPPEGTE